MSKICKNCAAINPDSAAFCKDCGRQLGLQPSSRDRKFTTALIIIIALVIAGFLLYDPGVIESEVPLETMDFEEFAMDVPVGSEFEDAELIPEYVSSGRMIYVENIGDYSDEVQMIGVTRMGIDDDILQDMDYVTTENDVDIYADVYGEDFYVATKTMGNYDFVAMGSNPDVMVKMLNSVEFPDA